MKKGSVAILLPPEVLLPSVGEREALLEKVTKQWEEISATNRNWGSAIDLKWTTWGKISNIIAQKEKHFCHAMQKHKQMRIPIYFDALTDSALHSVGLDYRTLT